MLKIKFIFGILTHSLPLCHQSSFPIPAYASKWNPIEHRVFPHVTKALDGIVLKTEEQVAEIISTTKTKSGLSVIASVIKKAYTKGKEWTRDVLEKVQIQHQTSLGQFNYKITPQTEEVLLKC